MGDGQWTSGRRVDGVDGVDECEATSTYKKGKKACCFFSCPTAKTAYFH